MVPKDPNFSNKFVVASKIFVSVIPDSNTLIPEKLASTAQSEVPSNVYLLDTPEDDGSWFKYMKVAKTPELFEEACSIYPKYWKVYYRHALYYIYNRDSSKAFEVFNEALKSYLVFLYHTASIHEYIGSLVNAIEKAGFDYRSDTLWTEWAIMLVKIYNCNLLALGMTSGLLPDIFAQDQNLLKTPLVPSETEQLVFRSANSLDPSNRTYLEMYGELNSLRNLFHRWLRTPTNNMRALWDSYSIFENTVDSTGTLSSKLLGEMKTVINLTMRSYERITELYSKVYPIKPASYEGTMSSQENVSEAVGYWMEIIMFEESNPMEVDNELVVERVVYNFERALCPLVFCREMWYRYFQYLLFTDKREQAISKIKMALGTYLKEDDKLRFVLALYLQESGEVDKAHEEFASLVAPGLKSSELDSEVKEEVKLRSLLECKDYLAYEKSELDGIVHYLNFVRREMGNSAWREHVQLILAKSDLNSWELYWYAASTELRCFRDHDRAVQILKQAQSKMAFNFKYMLLFFNTLLNVGKHNDVRILISQLIVGSLDKGSKMTEADRENLWNFWMNMEYLYGTAETFDNVKSLYLSSVVSSKLGIDTFTEKSKHTTEVPKFPLYSDVGEAFKKSGSTSKRQIANDFSAIVESRKKLFCSGVSFDHLDKIFKFNVLHHDAPEPKGAQLSPEARGHLAARDILGPVAPATEVKRESEHVENEDRLPRKDTKKGRGKKAKPQASERGDDEVVPEATRAHPEEPVSLVKYGTRISRPNVTKLSEIEPKMTTSLESLLQLHGSRRPIMPPKFRTLDATSTPCKALFDFIRILPSSRDNKFSNLYVNTESVDYLIRTVENMDLDNVEVDQYEPLPINLAAQLKETDETLNEKSFEFNQGLENILRFLQDNSHFEDKPGKRQRIAI
ncbi:conserved hypothetical protein [Theileria orientalis strain Shintoku]|uniref:Suppressor of forked domain-containing protein n=1 Tax=Theileria orientalis strain Shintoku TaxID=869250 RepID=J7MGP4_THEOR|nr:conserved hypothetical protein [Theileria orientalis strain Shintoku]BAM38651.1 conserved hypothetical protein [Theileria orientalis strain Shintoku]|eukprot:XP_009688952.1 conserved hypothetical protein [Theileria orientalis strain Shintoku]